MPYEPIGVYPTPPPTGYGEGVRSLALEDPLDEMWFREGVKAARLATRARDAIYHWLGSIGD